MSTHDSSSRATCSPVAQAKRPSPGMRSVWCHRAWRRCLLPPCAERSHGYHDGQYRRRARRPQRTPMRRFSQSRPIALDMESATIAANGFRFRIPYGTLFCVSDKPLHGEIKLPGMANQFYRERWISICASACTRSNCCASSGRNSCIAASYEALPRWRSSEH